jgi:predicted GNAT superfamily acetyltransferase
VPAVTPTDGVVVRDAEPGDLDRLHEINAANVPEVGDVDRARLQFLLDESTVALVVDVAGEVAGFCVVLPLGSSYESVNYRWFSDRYDDVAYLDRVAVDARYRRRGLGSALYRAVERRVAAAGVAAVALEVNVDPPNEPSLAFHARQGYREVGRQDTPYGIVVAMMRKEVATLDSG